MNWDIKSKSKSFITEFIVVLAVIIAGAALQFVAGPFDIRIIAFPVNLIFLLIFLLIVVLKPSTLVARFGTLSMSVIIITVLTLLSIFMGLIPENSIKSSWPFVLTYLMLMTNLALVIGRRIRTIRLKDVGFMLNHIGLFILLFAAGFGASDGEKYFMRVYEGKVECRGRRSGSGDTVELPLAILLKDFEMEEYSPKLAVINKKSGDALPIDKIDGWSISVDSVIDIKNIAPASYILAKNNKSGEEHRGWISCGNNSQPFKALDLTKEICVVMTFPEPKSFSSEVEVNTESGSKKSGFVRVNHPLTVGRWKIYQYSYDTEMGKDSAYSVFELVYDPWLIPAYIGIVMLFIGAVTLFWKGGKNELE
ncbi:MAG: cytochrome c biogenesis protein ResB [Rikenellaceae bacterium]